MSRIEATVVAKDYGFLAPLALGDVRTEQFKFLVDRDTKNVIDRTLRDPEVMIGESSISRHVTRLAAGDDTWIAIPYFLMRAFRHRCFYVRSGDDRLNFQDLTGSRIGTDNWMASGNTWSRAAMREQGVGIDRCDWVCGTVTGPPEDRPQGNLPTNVSMAPPDRNLFDMLLSGDLDALMYHTTPPGFDRPDSPTRRLFVDVRETEASYLARTGIWPGIHLAVVRRTLFEEHPTIVVALQDALEQSRDTWLAARRYLNETPWMLNELESSGRAFGGAWTPEGFDATRDVVRTFCHESHAQGLSDRLVEPEEIFAEYLAEGGQSSAYYSAYYSAQEDTADVFAVGSPG